MPHSYNKFFDYIFGNKQINLLFRALTIVFIIILAVAFTISITYSMNMNDSFNNGRLNWPKRQYSKNILVVMYQTSDDFLQKFKNEVCKKAEANQIFIDFVNAESINDAINKINTAVAAKVDGIIAQGIYDSNYIQAVNKAIEKGITVEFVFNDALGADRAFFVGYNAYDYGKMAARSAINQLHDTSGCIALMVQSATSNEKDVTGGVYIEGFKSIIDKYPRVKLVDIMRTSYDMFSAEDITYDILNQYPDINVIVCTSERDAFGVAQVVIDLNRVGDIKIIGSGVSKDIIKYIELGVIASSFDINPGLMGKLCIQNMVNNKMVNEYFEVPIELVTSDNVHKYKK